MKNFQRINNITGWVIFAIAAFVYLSTIEPTASFWDCGEFISCAFKMEVGHPPGAPLFLMMGRIFTLFAGDVTKVAITVNIMSALASAFTILFLFWTITHLARKIYNNSDTLDLPSTIAIMGTGIVGALSYTFSDTFWFSAVEGEVYASSSLLTALVFWAILKWENDADEEFSNRWIILIAYLTGLSIGIHLLNLLAIPAIGLVYYFKKYIVTRTGTIFALIISAAVLGAVMYIIIPGVVSVAALFERIFVNGFSLPYSSGVIFYALLLIGAIIFGIYKTYEKQQVLANTILLGIAVIILGYSSYTTIVIRSAADPPMDQNDPDNLFSLLRYLNREQYGDRPLIYGQYYNAPMVDQKEGKATFTALNGKYEVTNRMPKYIYDSRFTTLFPRMYSPEPDHVEAYKKWAKVKGVPIQTTDRQGQPTKIYKPTFMENLRFFVRYQIGHMYLRYFMWNFAGRQNDVQSHFDDEITKGNWLCGINFIDAARLGPQDKLPASLKNNKARNTYFLLPLILGLIGMFYQYRKQKKDFFVVLLLFFMTGLAIVIYLNQTPIQPRERDYAYAGSFYAFTIWIGFGVLGLFELLTKKIPAAISAVTATVICLLAVPAVMASENWDDHDRSGRYTARDFAYNYLSSCEKEAVLYTNGDNDTFPLWYVQEVEGYRTDVRVCNLSYLGADWYISQMQRKAYDSDPIDLTLGYNQYITGQRDIVYIFDKIKEHVDLKKAIEFIASDDPKTKQISGYGDKIDYIPAKTFEIPVDSISLLKNGIIDSRFSGHFEKSVVFTLNQRYILKNSLMVLDMLATNNLKRPIYFAITVSSENYLGLDDYFLCQGLTYLISPIKTTSPNPTEKGRIDTKAMYDNMMNKFKWGGVNDPKVYLDENNLRMLSNFRNTFARLAQALLQENKRDSARMVLTRCLEVMPKERVPYNYFITPMADCYYQLGDYKKGNELLSDLNASMQEELDYYVSLPAKFRAGLDYEIRLNAYVKQEILQLATKYNQIELKQKVEQELNDLMGSPNLGIGGYR